jgi:predicted anti-sigma-YlaC factor YlaD
MTTNSSFHPPIVLADARERRARKQRPYPEVCEYTPPTSAEIAEADERHVIARGNRWARSLVLLTFVLVLVALGLHLYFR